MDRKTGIAGEPVQSPAGRTNAGSIKRENGSTNPITSRSAIFGTLTASDD
ncbi:hypothetical protein RCO27_01680 [Sphingosinicella sp. LHD-64]|nr:hypothetical protein [Sphingosinicella sp. LHD-64]MDQ8754927.1 hypothetical protein [Sphingosinicella sp. LHD-64]